jgi:hypothetical protein
MHDLASVLHVPGTLSSKWSQILEMLSAMSTDLTSFRELLSSRPSNDRHGAMQVSTMALMQPQTANFSTVWTTTAELIEFIQQRNNMLSLYDAAAAAAAASDDPSNAPLPAYPLADADSSGSASGSSSGSAASAAAFPSVAPPSSSPSSSSSSSSALVQTPEAAAAAVAEVHSRINAFNELCVSLVQSLQSSVADARTDDPVVPVAYKEWASAPPAEAGAGAHAELLAALRMVTSGVGLK